MPWLSLIAVIVSFCGGIVLGMTILMKKVYAWREAQKSLDTIMQDYCAQSRQNRETIKYMLADHDVWKCMVKEQISDCNTTLKTIRGMCISMKDGGGNYLDSERLARAVERECSGAIDRSDKRTEDFYRIMANRKVERYRNSQ